MRICYILFIFVFASFVYSCKPKQTCAAYHSTFILYPEDQKAYFSYFDNDSVPKWPGHGHDKNGLAKGGTVKTYKKRHYTVPMRYVRYTEKEEEFETNATDIDNMKEPPGVAK